MAERLVTEMIGDSILKVAVKESFEDVALMMIYNPKFTPLDTKAIAKRTFPKVNVHSVSEGHDYEMYSSRFDRAVAHLEKNHDWDKEPNVAITFDENGEYVCWTFEF